LKRLCPGKRFLAGATAGALVLSAAAPALSFELFGRKFFEREEETAVVPDAQLYALDFTVVGGDKELTRTVENASSLSRDEEILPPGTPGLVARARGDYGRILAALYSQGRYGGSVEILIQGQPADTIRPDIQLPDPVPVTVTVDPGPLFRFGAIRIDGLPDTPLTEEDEDALNLDDWVLVQGEEARSGAILDTEGRLIEFWRQRGHPTARVPTREIVADHRTKTVDVVLAVESGPAAVLGPADIAGTERMDPLYVQWMTGIRPGEPYDPDTLRRSRERLQRLGVFSSVAVEEEPSVGPDGILPVTFRVSERKRRLIGGGASYSTVDGAALEAYWQHRNLFGRAESLRLEGSVSRIGAEDLQEGLNYSVLATFRKPGVFTPDTDFTFELGGRREYLDNYESLTVFARPGFERRFSDQLTGRAALNIERSRVEDAFGTNDYMILSLPTELEYDGSDNKLDPTEGFRATLNAEPFLEFERSTTALIASGSLSAYRSFGDDDRVILAARGALGSIVGASSIEDIPANRRFFLGGGGSIRGYEYRSVGPRQGDDVVGGLSFWEASFETRVRVTERIGLVPFIDAGAAYAEAIPDFSEDIRVGAGLGIRYNTGLGPIRFDVAVPLNRQDDDPSVAFYVGLGQAF
jgi:translocation and assembly module TamA